MKLKEIFLLAAEMVEADDADGQGYGRGCCYAIARAQAPRGPLPNYNSEAHEVFQDMYPWNSMDDEEISFESIQDPLERRQTRVLAMCLMAAMS